MTAITHNPSNDQHALPGHPEHPGRYSACMSALAKSGLLARMTQVPPRLSTEQEILAVHRPPLVERIVEMVGQGGGMLDPDTYCTSISWDIARQAAGGLIDLCRAVTAGEYANGLAVSRPPGHHATAGVSMGFCLINQIAMAASALQNAPLESKNPHQAAPVGKVAIVDIDAHHGNGTEDIFVADDSVLYISTHQFPHYPGTGRATDCGTGPGKGFTLNLPLSAGDDDDIILPVYQEIVVPALRKFQPDFLLVSAGFDAHRDDPLAELNLSTTGYMDICSLLTQAAAEICAGKIVFNLEGGYNLEMLGNCVTGVGEILLAAARPHEDKA